jgi:hypothetical protein
MIEKIKVQERGRMLTEELGRGMVYRLDKD